MTTLSISLNDDVLRRAEEWASERGTTVAALVERYVEVMAIPVPEDLPPSLRAVIGILPPMTDEEVDRVLDEERMRKYGGA